MKSLVILNDPPNGNGAHCAPCMTACGVGAAGVAERELRSILNELAAWTAAADKIPVF